MKDQWNKLMCFLFGHQPMHGPKEWRLKEWPSDQSLIGSMCMRCNSFVVQSWFRSGDNPDKFPKVLE